MGIKLAYMDDTLKIDCPDSIKVDRYKPLCTENSLNFDSFKSECENSNVSSFLDSDKLLIIVNDAHRSTPTSLILSWYKKLFPTQFSSATFLVACGTHDKPSESEYITIFGDLYQEIKDSVYYHDCHNDKELQLVGKDSFGEDFLVNKKLFQYDKVWLINSVEPHYFAGFTGGRKSIVPGLADFKTIERNHNLANSLECAPTKLLGNPMAEHLDSLVNLIEQDKYFSLQIVTDKDKKIANLSFGTLKDAFQNAVIEAEKIYISKCSSLYDLLFLEILPPLDRSIYQAQKALENNQASVKNNGSIIICSACVDGVGSEHFFKLVENWDAEKNCPKDGKLSFGSHKLKRVNDISKRIKVYLKSEAEHNIVSKLFYTPLDNVSEYVAEISKNKDIKIGVVYDAAHVVLKLSNM